MKREDAERLARDALNDAWRRCGGDPLHLDLFETETDCLATAILPAVAEERERCERIARRYDAEAWGHSNRSVAFNVAQNIADIIAGRLPDRQPEEPAR